MARASSIDLEAKATQFWLFSLGNWTVYAAPPRFSVFPWTGLGKTVRLLRLESIFSR